MSSSHLGIPCSSTLLTCANHTSLFKFWKHIYSKMEYNYSMLLLYCNFNFIMQSIISHSEHHTRIIHVIYLGVLKDEESWEINNALNMLSNKSSKIIFFYYRCSITSMKCINMKQVLLQRWLFNQWTTGLPHDMNKVINHRYESTPHKTNLFR